MVVEGGGGVNLTTDLHLVPRSRMPEPDVRSPICLHSIVLNYIITVRFNIVAFGKCYRSWSRHYATIRKVAGSIPDEIIGLFQLI
jgi:hypothetical protein